MINFNVSADRYAQFMDASLGLNGVDKKKATSPDTLLERVIDFLTLGKLHKRFVTEYDNFTAAVTKAIEDNNKNQGRYTIPQELTLDYEGHQVSFTPKHGANDEPKMVIEIAGAVEKKEISQNRYKNFCTLQLLRENWLLRDANISLTKDGALDLKKADLTGLSLSGIDLSHAILNHANFTDADLSGADLQGAQCENTNFKGANLQGARCQEAKFNDVDLRDITIAKTDTVLLQYFKTDKKRTEDIRALCDKIVKEYEKDSNGKVENTTDGVFRIAPRDYDVNNATVSLNRGELDIEKVDIHMAATLIKREFRAAKPLNEETFARIEANPEQALQLLLDRFAAIAPETGKRCHMILATFAVAYDNADDDNASKSNKGAVLSCAVDQSIFGRFSTVDTATPNQTTTYNYSERLMKDFILHQKAPTLRHGVDAAAAMPLAEPMHLTEPMQSAKPISFAEPVQSTASEELAGPISALMNTRVYADAIIVEANEVSRQTQAKSLSVEIIAKQPAQNMTPAPHQDDDLLPVPLRANDGGRASATEESQITTGTIKNAAEPKRIVEEKEERSVQSAVKQKRSKRHDAAVIDTYAARGVKSLTDIFEHLAKRALRYIN